MKTGRCVSLIIASLFCWKVTNVMAQANQPNDKKIKQESVLDKFSELKKKAMIELGMTKEARAQKIIKKSKQPEIILTRDKIYFNGKELRLGDSFDLWRKIIPGIPRCNEPRNSLCIWDELGLDIGLASAKGHEVKFLNIQFSISEDDRKIDEVDYPDGQPAGRSLDLNPHYVFPGYLELDGFAIDSETEFWEIRQSANQERLLDCGLRDCSHPSGAFGESAHIYLRLDKGSRYGRLRRLSIDADD
jgi:hypothetical protein